MEASVYVLERPDNYQTKPVDYDVLWKKVIADLFEECMYFFAPDLAEIIDFSREPDFLQQELYQQIIRGKKGRKLADQIVKVQMKDGMEQWVLIHIEIQGKAELNFAKRMFQYYYRIYDKFEKRVYALAILTDANKRFRPNMHFDSFHGTRMEYEFNVYKLIDQKEQDLSESTNPFAKVILAGIYMIRTKDDAKKRSAFKLKLMREVIKLEEDSRPYVQALFYFIEYLLELPDDLEKEIREAIIPIIRQEASHMIHSEEIKKSRTLAEAFALERRDAEVKGEIKRAKTVALNMLNLGLELDVIAKATELSIEDIQQLRESVN